jgi:hypothetical protein
VSFAPTHTPLSVLDGRADFRALLLPESPHRHEPKLGDGRYPPDVCPSKALSRDPGGTGLVARARTLATSPTPPPMHLALRPVLRSVAPNRARHLLLAEAPAFLGFLTLSRPGTFEPIQVSVTGSAITA